MDFLIEFFAHFFRRPRRTSPVGPVSFFALFRARECLDALARLDGAKASEVRRLGPQLAEACVGYGDERRQAALYALDDHPLAAWILTFFYDGYVRQAALRRLSTPAITPGRFIALALRLNDWVPNVRREAIEALRRVWPLTSPEVIAQAMPYLLRQRFVWRRWADEAAHLDEILGSPDVAEALMKRLLRDRSGGQGRTLSQALRFTVYDPSLLRLAAQARHPEVRAVALKTIFSGKATWRVGDTWTWADKSLGTRRRAALTRSRQVAVEEPADLLAIALADTSSLVRKIAADVVVERMNDLPDIAGIAARLVSDRNAAVRMRGDYIQRHLTPPADQITT